MSDADRPPDDQEPTRLSGSELAEASARRGEPPALRRLGDFELIGELGRGGMGVVYEARQLSLKRRVALKVLPPAIGLSQQARQRFEREAQAAAKLHHTNIVPVHAIGEDDGHQFYAMELIEGKSLDQVLRHLVDEGADPLLAETVTKAASELPRQPLPAVESKPVTTSADDSTTSLGDTTAGSRPWFDAVAKLIAEVADALDYAHGRGVIHRDIKPANLMLSGDGKLSITDFGLARIVQEPGMTVSGSFLGTPAYMSPEQIAAGRVKLDHRTDIYSLGAVLYELLTLQRPFGGESREEVLSAIMAKDPRSPRKFNSKIPQDLETICLKALEKDPDRRYATAGELAQDLRQYLIGGLIAARRAGIARRTWKSIRRHPVAATVAVAALVVVIASVMGWQAGGRAEEAQRLVADARLALREGMYREGLQLIDRAVTLDPDSTDARLVRAHLLNVNWRYRESADEALDVLRRDPQNVTAHAIVAGMAMDGGIFSIDPESHVRFVEARAPDSVEAYLLRALATENARRRIELLDRALDLDPGNQFALLVRLRALAELRDFEVVLSEVDRLIAIRPKSAQGWRFKAYAYQGQRDFKKARSAIERAMEIDDLDPVNYQRRSAILRDMGEREEAFSDLNRAIELNPAIPDLYKERAARLNGMGRFEEAIANARKSIELNPDDAGGFSQLLLAQLRLAREDRVRATIDELLARAEGWFDVGAKAWAHRTAADYYRQLKDYDQALVAVERAMEIDHEDFWNFIFRMRIHRELEDQTAAEADCAAAAAIELDAPQDLHDRGYRLMDDCNDLAGAIADFDRVVELTPKWYWIYVLRGGAHLFLARPDRALTDYDRSVELAPYSAHGYANRAAAYWDLGRFDECLADMERALELDPAHWMNWSNYSEGLRLSGRLEEALDAQDRALELNPRFGSAHALRGQTLAWLGRCDEAAVALRKAEDVAPLETGCHAESARAQVFAIYYNCPRQYDPQEALRHARFAYDAHPGRLRGELAGALFRNGDYAEAKRFYQELFEENPDRDAWFPLAICLQHLGEKAEARQFYDRSVIWMEERQPRNPELIRLREEAAGLLGIER